MTADRSKRWIVSERERDHALECLRFEADCMQLARDTHSPNLQSHFLRMATFWSSLANRVPAAIKNGLEATV
jgi:hypothetical protein